MGCACVRACVWNDHIPISWQARKALKALRGLVKIQALVRGHLVRKQTSDMLRCMNALMSIQVRARVQRIQMTEEPPVIVKRRITHRESAQEKQLSRGYSVSFDFHPNKVSNILVFLTLRKQMMLLYVCRNQRM